ncbi:MAG: tyrosine-type recombinase/integrase [Rhizobiales bacterium]|nr:tyrosine-type recombinase/integrase [Hyphomicrobiales bacterium]
MATFTQLGSGNWRVQVRRKGLYVANSFRRRHDAAEWALEAERSIDRGIPVKRHQSRDLPRSFRDLIDLHIADLQEVGKPIRRSKSAVMDALKHSLGQVQLRNLTRERLIEFGKKRAKQGAGPTTLSIDFSFIRTILTHAAAVHGIEVSAENVRLARVALTRLGLIGKGSERDRRPTQDELDRIIEHVESNSRQIIPMGRIIRFAVSTAMRQEEICKIEWSDVDMKKRTVRVRDRKDPRRKDGNHQTVPLLNLTGYDAWEVLLEQRIVTRGKGRVFPHHGKSVGAAFRRACQKLEVEDLHFHDLRHEATSRLFEAGLSIERVALVTGHKDWRMLKRYTNLKPEDLHRLQKNRQRSLEEQIEALIAL